MLSVEDSLPASIVERAVGPSFKECAPDTTYQARIRKRIQVINSTRWNVRAEAKSVVTVGQGDLVQLTGQHTLGCLSPDAVGRVEAILPREFRPVKVLCETGVVVYYRKKDLEPAPADAKFIPPAVMFRVGALVISAVGSNTCFLDGGPEDVGKVLKVDRSDHPYHIDCPAGRVISGAVHQIKQAPPGAKFIPVCASICARHHCGTHCPICTNGGGTPGYTCNGCESDVVCKKGSMHA